MIGLDATVTWRTRLAKMLETMSGAERPPASICEDRLKKRRESLWGQTPSYSTWFRVAQTRGNGLGATGIGFG